MQLKIKTFGSYDEVNNNEINVQLGGTFEQAGGARGPIDTSTAEEHKKP